MTDMPEESPQDSSHRAQAPSRTWGIRFKLTLLTLVLISLLTSGSFLVVSRIMDEVLLQSLVKRGTSIALSAATPAGYSILSDDRLALDNLAAKIEESQDDIAYLAILDVKGTILAHSRLEATGAFFVQARGSLVEEGENFSVKRVRREGFSCYEFRVPILFAGSRVGEVIVGIDTMPLDAARTSARNRIFWISLLTLAFGVAGASALSALITTPIKRLAAGVSKIKSGDFRAEVEVTSRDELGELTRSFNEMSQVIVAQKESLEGSAKNLEDAYLSTIRILAAALDARDNYTLGHSARVAKLSLLIGQRLGLEKAELKDLEIACFLHDIGKIHVPDRILNKETSLDQNEYQVIKKHPEQGAAILRLADSLHKYIPAVLHHHEWHDGRGYPVGLKGEEIHLYAQIVAIADSFDAMISSRPYRKGRARREAAEEIRKFRGTQFAPHLVDLFLNSLDDYEDDQDPPLIKGSL